MQELWAFTRISSFKSRGIGVIFQVALVEKTLVEQTITLVYLIRATDKSGYLG